MSDRTDLLDGFRSLYRVENAARTDYFTEGTVVLDTNFILDLYRLSTTARGELMQILRGFGPRLLVPHQIAVEFHRRRVDAVVGRINEIEEVKASIRKSEAGARSILSQALQRAHGSSQMGKTSSDLITQTFESLRSIIDGIEADYNIDPDKIATSVDPILAELNEVLAGCVLPPPSESQIEADEKEAARRAKATIPPGFKDGAKEENPYGDYLWWAEVIRNVEGGRPLLILSNESAKGD